MESIVKIEADEEYNQEKLFIEDDIKESPDDANTKSPVKLEEEIDANVTVGEKYTFQCNISETKPTTVYLALPVFLIGINKVPNDANTKSPVTLQEKIDANVKTGKPFYCHICNHKFARDSQLKSHMSVHSSEKPFQYKICNSKYTRKSNLKKHMTLHAGEKPF